MVAVAAVGLLKEVGDDSSVCHLSQPSPLRPGVDAIERPSVME